MSSWSSENSVGGLVSVMVPTYNRRGSVLATLESVKAQTYRPIELVIVDDGSTDGTEEVVEKWAASEGDDDFPVRYEWKENGGLTSARNRGVALSWGEFLQFLDSDDVIHPEKIALSVGALRDEAADVAVCKMRQWRDWEEVEPLLSAPPRQGRPMGPHRWPEYITRAFWGTAGPVFRRGAVIEAGPFPKGRQIDEEIEFHARVKCVAPRVVYLPGFLAFYRVGDGNQMTARRYATARCNTAPLLESTLSRYEIDEIPEWRRLLWYSLTSGYRAAMLGDREAAGKALGVARRAAMRARRYVLGGVLACPSAWVYAGLRMVGAIRSRRKAPAS